MPPPALHLAFGRTPEPWLRYDPYRQRAARGAAAVATANPLASWAAASTLRAGGSAIDAAIAAQMVLCVVEPNASGLGGGAMILVHHAPGEVAAYDGLSAAPARVTDRLERDFDGRTIPADRAAFGGRTVGVPGALRALELAHRRHGRLAWAELLQPAIALAEDGFPLSPYLWRTLQEQVLMAAEPFARAVFCGGGDTVLPAGTTLRNPAVARTLRRIAAGGADELYLGETGAAVLRAVRDDVLPSTLTPADLAGYAVRERPPVRYAVGAMQVATAPLPAFGGTAAGQIVGLALRVGVTGLGPLPELEEIHLLAECGRLAFAERNRYAADPDHEAADAAAMLDSAYLDSRAGEIGRDRVGGVIAADAGNGGSMTSHLAIADGRGQMVSMTTTLNQNFGARIAVEGFYLNNVQTNFAAAPEQGGRRVLNAMAPGKRPRTTFAPTIVMDAAGEAVAALGAGGGHRIIGFVANALLRLAAGERDAQALLSSVQALHWNGLTELEPPLAAHLPALAARGHWLMLRRMDAAAQCVLATRDGFAAAGDPRRDGVGMAIGEV
jgi:gamma-glutamyltranspeptidase/glutathione hydrolase